ncbi:N-acetylmuramoyl-L-alanine amidase [Cyanobacterium stanieri LEGE 03274]|uniref:N-acetylmuramoyl-L-alanine amidase n=1 Tax=Cyanobacterium stanieri LEGE 03274 TaxID=1828756 RepID=A0ABR9V066_9CHRO|nr:N-acetylmuramoyl-L-alanine amidase [Cyanobacterium stanieri]MBE9221273.1 N-acetylmuramoyl-L-alanine amidase [Cyanobacterium stanieri LEGE 03274]
MYLRSIILATIIFPWWGLSAWASSLQYWKFNQNLSRLEIVTENNVIPRAQLMANPTRLVVDLPNTRVGETRRDGEVSSYVREVRVGQLDSQTTRLVVELTGNYTMRPWQIKVRSLAPNRWYVQLPKFQTPDIYSLPDGNTVAIAVPAPTIATATQNRGTVVIDPGHGGRDPGAIGLRGVGEKGIVLEISQETARVLRGGGYQVIMTRNSDVFVSLEQRARLANDRDGDVFVSIHANAVGGNRPEVNGLETYYFQTGRLLAHTIHRTILRRLSVGDRNVRQARFYVLRNTNMPAVLVEVGFLTGATDNRNLSNSSYRRQMGEAIAHGIMEYLR